MSSELPGPFDVHDPGCSCWPHVSAGPAQEAVIEAARQEYVAGRAARLSHDRGADAHDSCYVVGGVHLAPCLSVPAPTLPALDVELLAKALTAIHGLAVPLPNRPTPHEYAVMIATWYAEALRDAVSPETRA